MTIEVRNLSKQFGTFSALRDVSLQVQNGELLALLGPSGSGKTTLLRIIAGLEVPDTGQVLFQGEDSTDRHVRDRQVGFVFQHYALFRHMTIFENVAFGLRVRPKNTRPEEGEIRERVLKLLKLVQLDWLADRYPHQLSGGQRQRIALGARPGRRTEGAAARRTVRRTGCEGAQGAAPLAAPAARRHAHHQRVSLRTTRKRRWKSPTAWW